MTYNCCTTLFYYIMDTEIITMTKGEGDTLRVRGCPVHSAYIARIKVIKVGQDFMPRNIFIKFDEYRTNCVRPERTMISKLVSWSYL